MGPCYGIVKMRNSILAIAKREDLSMKWVAFLSRNKKYLFLIGIFVFVLVFVYFGIYFQKGMRLRSTFLKKTVTETGVVYTGRDYWGKETVTVINKSEDAYDIIYELPSSNPIHYTLKIETKNGKSRKIQVLTEDTVIFQGEIIEDRLYDAKGELFFDWDLLDYFYMFDFRNNPYDQIIPSVNRSVRIVLGMQDCIRGKGNAWIGILLLFMAAIDMRYPLLFFQIRQFGWSKNAEPSDFFLLMQKIDRVLLFFLAIAIFIYDISTYL